MGLYLGDYPKVRREELGRVDGCVCVKGISKRSIDIKAIRSGNRNCRERLSDTS